MRKGAARAKSTHYFFRQFCRHTVRKKIVHSILVRASAAGAGMLFGAYNRTTPTPSTCRLLLFVKGDYYYYFSANTGSLNCCQGQINANRSSSDADVPSNSTAKILTPRCRCSFLLSALRAALAHQQDLGGLSDKTAIHLVSALRWLQ